jgi:hypothetical protein
MSSAGRSQAFTYLDLLNGDGTRNEAAFAAILASRIEAEINLALCGAARVFVPKGTPLGAVQAWRREAAAGLDPTLVSRAERDRIVAHEHAELTAWVAAMQRGARQLAHAIEVACERQAAFAQAAE